jgi:AcrR family transcriptional regulator
MAMIWERGLEGLGLRERKKIQTRRTLWRTAMGLFVEHGFDNVSVAQIAAAAEVSKMTVFNYFPTKEDLVLGPMSDHVDEPARVVAARGPGETPLSAIRRHFIASVEAQDPSSGLNDDPEILSVHRLIHETPVLLQRALSVQAQMEDLLARELDGPEPGLTARVVAAQLIGTRNLLINENVRRLVAGEPVEMVRALAVTLAGEAFGLLGQGLSNYAARTP